MNWWLSWDLKFDPFLPGAVPFVSTPEHEEAVARLVHEIRSVEPRISIEGESGSGTSTIMQEGIRRLRSPRTRVCLVRSPCDEWSMIRGICQGLGIRVGTHRDRSEGLSRLSDSIRLIRIQGFSVILAIDDSKRITDRSLDRLVAVGRQAEAKVTVVTSGVSEESITDHNSLDIRIRVRRLTRSMTQSYLTEKLRAAGRADPVFTDRAMLELHARSGGLPRRIDRLARLSLMAGTLDRLTMLPVEVIAEVSREFQEFPGLASMPN